MIYVHVDIKQESTHHATVLTLNISTPAGTLSMRVNTARLQQRRRRHNVDPLPPQRMTTWATSSSGANTAETAAIDVNGLAVIRYLVVRDTATGARENDGISERQNTSMLKATSELLVVSNLLVTERMTDEVKKLLCTALQKHCVSDGTAHPGQ